MADATLYLFDGYNMLYAGPYRERDELVDVLASFVAMRGARGVVVFDGVGEDVERGPLSVRYAPHADTLLERLAAEATVLSLVTSSTGSLARWSAAGGQVAKLSSQTFFRDHEPARHSEERPHGLAGKLDEATKARLERLRRGE